MGRHYGRCKAQSPSEGVRPRGFGSQRVLELIESPEDLRRERTAGPSCTNLAQKLAKHSPRSPSEAARLLLGGLGSSGLESVEVSSVCFSLAWLLGESAAVRKRETELSQLGSRHELG